MSIMKGAKGRPIQNTVQAWIEWDEYCGVYQVICVGGIAWAQKTKLDWYNILKLKLPDRITIFIISFLIRSRWINDVIEK